MQETLTGWHAVQDSLAGMSELELGLYGRDGQAGAVSGECPFCAELRLSNGGRARCAEECGKFASRALESSGAGPFFFKCWFGLKVFAVRLHASGSGGLVLCGGKTFESRPDYDAALEKLRGMGRRVQNTGRHRYRFAGKKRLDELVQYVSNAAEQYFNLSLSVSRYRLKLNRQAALVENASLLYQVNDLAGLVDGFMRALGSLFGLDRLSMHLYALGDGEKDRHFVRGAPFDAVFSDADLFADWLRKRLGVGGDAVILGKGGHGEPLGLSSMPVSAVCMPVIISGELVGFVCVFDGALSRDDMEAFRGYVQQIAAAIDNRRLRTGVLEKLNRLKAMSVLYASAGRMQDPDEIYRLLLEKSTELLKAERGSLMLINEKTDELFVKFSKGISEEVLALAPGGTGEGIAGRVARSGSPMVVGDARTEQRPGLSRRPEYKTDSFVSVPLKVRGRVVGVVNLTDKATGGAFDHEDLEFLLGLASHAGSALERTDFEKRTGRLDDIVVCDEITGLLRCDQFNGRLAEELERSRRYGHALSLMVMDVDGFSGYVSANGRQAADEALRRLTSLFVSSFRVNDILSRYQKDCFAFALPETAAENALALAERIRRRVEAARFPDGGMVDGGRLSVSAGVAVFPSDAEQPKSLFECALEALGSAKRAGKNRVRRFGGSAGRATS